MPIDNNWPILRTFTGDYLRRVAMPIGGIGTGTISLGGRGDLRAWEIMNRPKKPFSPQHAFFAIRMQASGGESATRVLEGPIPPEDYEGVDGCQVPNHTLPRFRECRFEAAYPFGQVVLADPSVPLDVRLQAFNPFIPADSERCGLPLVALRYVLTNKTGESVRASICGNMQNFVGWGLPSETPKKNVNEIRSDQGLNGIFMRTGAVDPSSEFWGTICLCTTEPDVSMRRNWRKKSWCGDLLDFWDDLSDDGRLGDPEPLDVDGPIASLCASVDVGPHTTREVTFFITWHFPNRMTWTTEDKSGAVGDDGKPLNPSLTERVGNYYTTKFTDAWDAAVRISSQIAELESETLRFVRAFLSADIPDVVKEAALFNASTLRTQTAFRTEDGRFYGWEGCNDTVGSCLGSCTHVWNYEQATAFLFGDLALCMRELEYLHATRDDGFMCFRIDLPLNRSLQHGFAAADGQMGCLMKLYRDWQMSGDTDFLKQVWPMARKTLEFAWSPGCWDPDRDGVMEGCQHNTMDVEYFGPNPEIGTWYLGALRAAEEMAREVGDGDFAAECHSLFERGRDWLDTHLFNGEYYEQEVRPIESFESIAPGLRPPWGATNPREPELQLGAACLIDQLVGQYMAELCGLGYLLDTQHVRKTLESIVRYNHRDEFHSHFNHVRSYALGDDAGVLVATYPLGRRPAQPFSYCNEVWTGLEYTLAVHLISEGMIDQGVKVIEDVRNRHDGRRRNPFDEAECGYHYARAMASWGAIPAMAGFLYSGPEQRITFRRSPGPATHFWSNGWSWGTCRQEPDGDKVKLTLTVLYGELPLKRIELKGHGQVDLENAKMLRRDDIVEVVI